VPKVRHQIWLQMQSQNFIHLPRHPGAE